MLIFIGYLLLLIAASGVWLATLLYVKPLMAWAERNTSDAPFPWSGRVAMGCALPAFAFLVTMEALIDGGSYNDTAKECLGELWRGAVYGTD